MVDNFPAFSKLVHDSYQKLVKGEGVFEVELIGTVSVEDRRDTDGVVINGEALYAKYLAAFPEGTNPVFRNRTEHDCSCCKQFIRRAGTVVATQESTALITIWDDAAQRAPYPYNEVARVLSDTVRMAAIANLYRVGKSELSFGSEKSRSQNANGDVVTWNHFYSGEVPAALRPEQPDTVKGTYRTSVQVFERGLIELKPEAISTVLDLVNSNGLYRGEEHKPALLGFQKAQKAYTDRSERGRHMYVWAHAGDPAARFRNTVIGTLVQDLSEGVDVEHAVKSFEAKVAPTNYKRPNAIVTPGMIKKAMETIQELGLEPALERRYARLEDISVNDVKWVATSVKPLMKGGIADVLLQHAASTQRVEVDEERALDIGLDEFIKTILPETTGMELLFKGEHLGNLMSLTAPVHPEPKQLFKWANDFAWSYSGSVADSIKERVKKAGGRVEGATLRVSLSWYNYDDLDLHVYEPKARGKDGPLRTLMSDGHIYFGSKKGWTGGELDVDMNAGSGRTREAVENIVWTQAPPDGVYRVAVNNYAQRETKDVGFVVELEHAGKLSHFSYNKTVRSQTSVEVCTLHVKDGQVVKIEVGDPGIATTNVSQDKWGLKTEQFVKVNAVTLSPNYWGSNAVGNKHTFFLLDGCQSDEPTRGIYNEFLHARLEPHRKVFEVIGEKTNCQPTAGQLSGLGYSSTKKDNVIVKVFQGKKQRLFKVNTGA